MHFYEVGGLLVRRWVPAQRRKTVEAWDGNGWLAYPDVDNLLRHGQRVTEAQALVILHDTRDRAGARPRLSDDDALAALHARLRRA